MSETFCKSRSTPLTYVGYIDPLFIHCKECGARPLESCSEELILSDSDFDWGEDTIDFVDGNCISEPRAATSRGIIYIHDVGAVCAKHPSAYYGQYHYCKNGM